MDQRLGFLVLVSVVARQSVAQDLSANDQSVPHRSEAAGTANSDLSTGNLSAPMLSNAAWIKRYQPHPKTILSMDSYGTDIFSVPQLQHIIFPAVDPWELHSVPAQHVPTFHIPIFLAISTVYRPKNPSMNAP